MIGSARMQKGAKTIERKAILTESVKEIVPEARRGFRLFQDSGNRVGHCESIAGTSRVPS